ncbi:hypothetical protein [Caproiciproducens sp. MSJ-32]|uniref:hypothetical protein n=1 Tax=Caproiciproducens sp. MSJ-32 TaxID=2841527 RepID=UPI001C119CA2|nr:hypothetical protein [Caproiciproducens sp. MSJ-32]MBU5454356.1 hypothetical protein [Caproiciproducens sp. MSJ-32]
MKKIIIYSLTIIISAAIPIYFLLIWEPLKSTDVISDNVLVNDYEGINNSNEDNKIYIINNSISREGTLSTITNLPQEKRDKLNVLLKNLSIVDIIKINNYFSDISNIKNIVEGLDLIEKRMSKENYQEFKNILEDYINLEEMRNNE